MILEVEEAALDTAPGIEPLQEDVLGPALIIYGACFGGPVISIDDVLLAQNMNGDKISLPFQISDSTQESVAELPKGLAPGEYLLEIWGSNSNIPVKG